MSACKFVIPLQITLPPFPPLPFPPLPTLSFKLPDLPFGIKLPLPVLQITLPPFPPLPFPPLPSLSFDISCPLD